MEETPLLQKRLKDLQAQVGPYSQSGISANFGFDILSSKKAYLGIPVVILLILVFTRPSVIMKEEKDGDKKISLQKLFLYWIVISALISLGLFGYNYKTKEEQN